MLMDYRCRFHSFNPKSSLIKNERIIGLDILRCIAILTVVICHSSWYLSRLSGANHFGKVFAAIVDFVQPFGPLGVELFFVLSGFLIGSILIRTFMSSTDFSIAQVGNFWIRRWFRTLPLYWLILTANIILYNVLHLMSSEKPKILYYFFLQNLWSPHPHFFFGESWSLSIEEWFYLSLPIAMYVSARVFRPTDRKQFLLKVFLGYLAVFLAGRVVNAFHPLYGDDQDFGIRKIVLFRLDAVMYGVLFAYFNIFHGATLARFKNLLLAFSITGVTFVYYLLSNPAIAISTSSVSAIRFVSDAFLYLLIPLSFSFSLPFANNIKRIGNRYISAVIRHISKISYSMYLTHYSLVFIPFFYVMKPVKPIVAGLMYVLYWVIVITLSSVLYRYFEHPMMRLRDRFSNKTPGEVN